ncbi:MAG TPA: hypothetical protein VG826_25150 [Pirellulales bacterium]|nr:hypothetical protein [Pirellulales bacterium]
MIWFKIGSACWATALLLLLLAFFARDLGIVADARPSAERAQCRANLQAIWKALFDYASLHGDVPRGNDGNASLEPLDDPELQKELGFDSSILRCPTDYRPEGRSYLLNPTLSVRDLAGDSKTIVACDRLPRHRYDRRLKSTMVLLGDGQTVSMYLSPEDQEEWRRLFLSGDKRACTMSTKDDSSFWAPVDVLWYVGEKKGYVANGF